MATTGFSLTTESFTQAGFRLLFADAWAVPSTLCENFKMVLPQPRYFGPDLCEQCLPGRRQIVSYVFAVDCQVIAKPLH